LSDIRVSKLGQQVTPSKSTRIEATEIKKASEGKKSPFKSSPKQIILQIKKRKRASNHGKKPLTCSTCDLVFSREYALNRHIEMVISATNL
jgi:hypothetical protein